MSDTEFSDDDMLGYALQEEEKSKKILLEKQNAFQEPETEKEKKFKSDYEIFLTFKAHGAGAFGSVTEYYDLYRRTRYARKFFSESRDMKIELEAYEKLIEVFGEEKLGQLISKIERMDVENNTLYYEQGVITLNDLCDKKMRSKSYWFEEEHELWYLISTLFDLIMEFCDKNVYHSDLKLVNVILQQDRIENVFLKFIDIGAVTFDYNHIIAMTEAYFPSMERFDTTTSRENRTLGELYQMGRMIQEMCLTSVYSKQQEIYKMTEEFNTYKKFKKYYFENSEQRIEESMGMIKRYFSKEVYGLVEKLLSLKSNVVDIKNIIKPFRGQKFLKDFHNYVQVAAEEKLANYLNSVFDKDGSSLEKQIQEFQFYEQFELDNQGFKKTNEYLGM